MRKEANESASIAKERGREVKRLGRQVRREQYVSKKAVRAAEDSASLAAQKIHLVIEELSQCTEVKEQRINELEHQVTELADKVVSTNKAYQKERRKKKSEALKEYADDVQRLQIKKNHLETSVDTWQTRYIYVCACAFIRSHPHLHVRTRPHPLSQTRQEEKKLSRPWSIQTYIGEEKVLAGQQQKIACATQTQRCSQGSAAARSEGCQSRFRLLGGPTRQDARR